MEIGIGIHGEPGRERKPMATAREVVEMLTAPIVADLPFSAGDKVLAFVNSMVGTPLIELYIAHRRAVHMLEAAGVKVARHLTGNFVTSLDMQGMSLSVLRADDELLRLWDEPVHTAALCWGC